MWLGGLSNQICMFSLYAYCNTALKEQTSTEGQSCRYWKPKGIKIRAEHIADAVLREGSLLGIKVFFFQTVFWCTYLYYITKIVLLQLVSLSSCSLQLQLAVQDTLQVLWQRWQDESNSIFTWPEESCYKCLQHSWCNELSHLITSVAKWSLFYRMCNIKTITLS